MRVVFVSDHFSSPDQPGILRTWQLARHLAGQGDEVVVIAPAGHYLFTGAGQPGAGARSGAAGPDLPDGVRVVRIPTSPLRRGSVASRLRYYAEQLIGSAVLTWRQGRCDVVVAGLTPSVLGIGAYCAARARGIPFVVDERDLALDAAEQAGLLPVPLLRAARRVERLMYDRAAAVVAVTPGLRSLLIERGVPAAKTVLSPNGYDGPEGDLPAIDRAALRDRLGWPDRTIVLYAGGLGQMYDLDVLLSALSLADRDRFQVVIMGEGEQKAHYAERCERERLPVLFPTPVAKADVPLICRAADICVVPLRALPWAHLAVSNKLFDYLGAARPVIVTGPGDSADLVRKAEAGLAVPAEDPRAFADALTTLAGDPAAAEGMGAAGREYVLAEWTRSVSARAFRSALADAALHGTRPSEHDRIRSVYRYYDTDQGEQRKRDPANRGIRLASGLRSAALRQVLAGLDLPDGARILDVGCGSGGDLRRLAAGLSHLRPALVGIDLLPDRIDQARRTAPEAAVQVGGAENLPYPDRVFDLVLTSTLFSSILDERLASAVAAEMTRVLAVGGVIVCYDVRYPNPWNPHTRALTAGRLRRLFPGADLRLRPVTLLPPLARRVGGAAPWLYRPLHTVPLLRSHYLTEIHPACQDLGVKRSHDESGDQRNRWLLG
ncbi:MAG: glycosyltransferase [Streptosporangiaceae bacterium]